MLMTSIAYSGDNDDHTIVHYLIADFTSQLGGWWENMLTDAHIYHIITSINEPGQQNVVHKLIYVITKHFIGDPIILQETSSKILQNLRCGTLSDFIWYHDVFQSKVMSRPDANASYWKEIFLFGLPRALTEKVQNNLIEKWQGIIPYDELTYGDLISEVKNEGLKLCSQLKLQYQVKKDLKASRKCLESFCNQYETEMPLLSSHKNKIHQNIRKSLTLSKEKI